MFWMRGRPARQAIAAIVLGALCALAVSAGEAWAGEYHVYSCRMPDGTAAPTDGWSEAKSKISDSMQDTCASGGSLAAGLSDGMTHEVETDQATWIFGAPAETTIINAELWRAGDADGGWATNATYEFWLAGPENKDIEADVFDQCVAEFGCPIGVGNTSTAKSSANLVTVPPGNLGAHLYLNVSCAGNSKFVCPSGKGDSNGYAAVVYLYAADLTLEQTSQPSVSNVEGELASAAPLAGTADLSFHASDSGSGVYQAVFTLDNVEIGRTLLNENGGHCHDVGQTTDHLPAFLYLRPCAPSLNADIPFDTTTLTDGTHHLVVSVTNAAGVSTVALDRRVAVLNHPAPTEPPPKETPAPSQPSPEGHPPTTAAKNEQLSQTNPAPQSHPDNGNTTTAGASLRVRWSATARTSLASKYGRAQTALGRLTASGAAIAGAQVRVLLTPNSQGARTVVLASPHTAANGSFRVRIPAGVPSSRLTFAYIPPDQAVPAVTAALALIVPARLTLRVTPRVSHIGGTLAFTGTLLGAPLPPGGKQLVLEARALGGAWRQFQVLSTAAHGRYHATYRFRLAGPISYEFRATSRKEADFPFAAGASNIVRVRER